MIEKGLFEDGVAPSYFIEGMLYNVANEHFSGTYQDMWVKCFNAVISADATTFTTASRMHWLVRDGSSVCWPSGNFQRFMAALKRYWES